MQFDVTILATNEYHLASILNEEAFFDKYLFKENDGYISLESGRLDSINNIKLLIKYLFPDSEGYKEIYKDDSKTILDLTNQKFKITTFNELDIFYPQWTSESGRENNMDEYGMLLSFIGYLQRNQNKNNLLIIIDCI